jgi:putative exporter of polyketide antibiotics
MEDFRLIDFHRQRDFGRKMNATFEFIRQNFKPLFSSILVITGPSAFVSSLVMGSLLGDFMGLMQSIGNANNLNNASNLFLSATFWLQIFLLMVFATLTFVLSISTINNYVILYSEKKSNKIEVPEVWDRVRQTFWMYFGTSLLFFLLFIAVYIVMVIPVAILGAISPALVFLGMLLFIVGLFYVLFGSSLTFFIRGYEKKGFFAALSRSFYLVRTKWWSTFGLIFLLSIIVGVISYIFMIPYYIVIFSTAMHQTNPETFTGPSETLMLVTKLFFGLYYFAQILLSVLPNVGIAFQYFNLVELKEAKGLMKDLENFGKAPDPMANRPEEHY